MNEVLDELWIALCVKGLGPKAHEYLCVRAHRVTPIMRWCKVNAMPVKTMPAEKPHRLLFLELEDKQQLAAATDVEKWWRALLDQK